jgi:hypothetical protein
MAIRLTFIDSDIKFAEKMAAWINKYMPFQFSVEILTSRGSLEAWIGEGCTTDLFIVSSGLFNDVRDLLPTAGVLVLDEGAHIEIDGSIPRASKYRPVEELMRDAMSLCADRMPMMRRSGRNSPKVTLVVCVEGYGASCALSYEIANIMGSKGRKTLYLSLEHVQATDLFLSGNNSRGLNEMLYYIKSNRDNLPMRLETCVSRDTAGGVDFLKSPPGLLDPGSIKIEDIEILLEAFAGCSAYSEIIVAADPVVDDKLLQLFKKSDRVVFSMSHTAGSLLRMKKIAEELDRHEDIAAIKNSRALITVHVPCEGLWHETQYQGIKAIPVVMDHNETEVGGYSDRAGAAALDAALSAMDESVHRHE